MSVRPTRTSCTMIGGAVLLLLTGVTGAGQAPRVDPSLPKPSGLSETDIAAVKLELAKLGGQVERLKAKYSSGAMHDRVDDVEIFCAGVHNQVEQTLRTDLARAQRALQMGLERAGQLMDGQTPWMAQN